MKVTRQQRKIARLETAGLAKEDAQSVLRALSLSLLQMRNHHDILENLISPPLRRTRLDF